MQGLVGGGTRGGRREGARRAGETHRGRGHGGGTAEGLRRDGRDPQALAWRRGVREAGWAAAKAASRARAYHFPVRLGGVQESRGTQVTRSLAGPAAGPAARAHGPGGWEPSPAQGPGLGQQRKCHPPQGTVPEAGTPVALLQAQTRCRCKPCQLQDWQLNALGPTAAPDARAGTGGDTWVSNGGADGSLHGQRLGSGPLLAQATHGRCSSKVCRSPGRSKKEPEGAALSQPPGPTLRPRPPCSPGPRLLNTRASASSPRTLTPFPKQGRAGGRTPACCRDIAGCGQARQGPEAGSH